MKEIVKITDFNNRGQVLLIVVVTMIVALTAGLAITSRTITNLKISKQQEESQRAFQAASAGIEKFLQSGDSNALPVEISTNATFDTTVTDVSDASLLLNNGENVDQDRGIDLWLSDFPTFDNQMTGNSFTVYWGTKEQLDKCRETDKSLATPALQILVLSGDANDPTMRKFVYDACGTRRADNNFSTPQNTAEEELVNGVKFYYKSDPIPLGGAFGSGLVAKIIPIYNSTKVAAVTSNGADFPSQGKLIDSTGSSGETKRKIIYYESHPQIPNEVFPYSVMSQ